MSRLSNLTTIKIGIFRSWNAYWFDKIHYATLLFNDLKIRDYLTGIFYRLKIITDYIYLYRLLNNSIIIRTHLIFFSNLRFKSITFRKVYHMDEQFVFFYKKRTWRRFLQSLRLFHKFNIRNNKEIQLRKVIQSITDYFFYFSFYSYTYILYFFLFHSKVVSIGITPHIISLSSIFNIYRNSNFNHNLLVKVATPQVKARIKEVIINNEVEEIVLFKFRKTTPYNYSNFYNYSLYSSFSLMFLTKLFTTLNSSIFLSKNWIFLEWFRLFYLSRLNTYLLMLVKYIYYFIYSFLNTLTIFSKKKNKKENISLYPLSFWNTNYVINLKQFNMVLNSYFPTVISKREITQSLFLLFRSKIEQTISKFEQQNIYLMFSISFKRNPFILSAKLITDALVFLLQSGTYIVKSFFFIKNWQSALYYKRRRLEYIYLKKKRKLSTKYAFLYATKRSPVIGIRIECSGTFKKGRMSRVFFYSSWVRNDQLTGKMPNNTLIADIDYYQSFARTKGSSIGIKTWIFLETLIYNNNHKYISLVY